MRRTGPGVYAIRVATSLASAALAVISLEGALRFGHRSAEMESSDLVQGYFADLYDYHPRLGWIPEPHARGVKWNVPVQTGAEGIRLNGHPLDLETTPAPILAVGDSFTFGDEVGDADTWPAHLEALLHQRVPTGRHQVLNAGVSSYGLDQMLLRAEALVPTYRPQIVIVSVIPDDIERCLQSIRHGVPKPYFIVTPEGLELRNVPTPAPNTPNRYRQYFLRHFLLAGVLARRSPLGPWLTAGTMSEVRQDDSRSALDIATRLIARFLALKRAYNFRLVALAQPESEAQTMDGATRAILDLVRSSADRTVAVVDAFDALRAHTAADSGPRRPFFHAAGGLHMSSAGNRFIAGTLLPSVLTLLTERVETYGR